MYYRDDTGNEGEEVTFPSRKAFLEELINLEMCWTLGKLRVKHGFKNWKRTL